MKTLTPLLPLLTALALSATLPFHASGAEPFNFPNAVAVGKPLVDLDFSKEPAGAYRSDAVKVEGGKFELENGALLITSDKSNPRMLLRENFPDDLVVALRCVGLKKIDKLRISLPNGFIVQFSLQFTSVEIDPAERKGETAGEPAAIRKGVYSVMQEDGDEIFIVSTKDHVSVWLNNNMVLEAANLSPNSNGELAVGTGWSTHLVIRNLAVFAAGDVVNHGKSNK